MEFLADDLIELVQRFMLPFIRMGTFFLLAPVFAAQSVPVRIRILLALVITALLFPTLQTTTLLDPLSAEGVVLIIQEVILGMAMGLVLQFVMAAIVTGGHAMATAMGLGFASSADPQNGVQVTIVGQFYLVLATLVFISIDGHLFALEIFASSFSRFTPGEFFLTTGLIWMVVLFSAQLFVVGVLLALPVMVGVLLVNLAFGVMTKASPQLNVFSIGFPMAMMAGFALMLLSLPVLLPLLNNAFNQTFIQLNTLLQ